MKNQTKKSRFAICINNSGYEDDIKLRTVYQVLPDDSAAKSNYLRIIDQTGEDYLFPAEYFILIEISQESGAFVVDIGIKFGLNNFSRPYRTIIIGFFFFFPPINRWAIFTGSRMGVNEKSKNSIHLPIIRPLNLRTEFF